jgi:hypothetical protein
LHLLSTGRSTFDCQFFGFKPLRRYIKALGTLEITARFPDASVVLAKGPEGIDRQIFREGFQIENILSLMSHLLFIIFSHVENQFEAGDFYIFRPLVFRAIELDLAIWVEVDRLWT